jgi:hypothetical protein
MNKFWFIASYVSLAYAALVTTALVATYAFTQWEKTQVGRQFMVTKACLAIIIDYWFVSITFIRPLHEYSSTMPPRAVICAIIGTVMLRWLLIIARVQVLTRRAHRSVWNIPEEPPPIRREQ